MLVLSTCYDVAHVPVCTWSCSHLWSGVRNHWWLDPEDFYKLGQSLGLLVPPPMINTINYA